MIATMLPIIMLQGSGKKYFYDKRLAQIRNIENPHDYINLSSNEIQFVDYWLEQPERRKIESFKGKEIRVTRMPWMANQMDKYEKRLKA